MNNFTKYKKKISPVEKFYFMKYDQITFFNHMESENKHFYQGLDADQLEKGLFILNILEMSVFGL